VEIIMDRFETVGLPTTCANATVAELLPGSLPCQHVEKLSGKLGLIYLKDTDKDHA
jgi:hypothetical protein